MSEQQAKLSDYHFRRKPFSPFDTDMYRSMHSSYLNFISGKELHEGHVILSKIREPFTPFNNSMNSIHFYLKDTFGELNTD